MKTAQAKQISGDFKIDETYKKLDIKDFKLPEFKPVPDIGNITNAYLSAFNTGMTIYECLSWLQGYVQANRDALVQLIGDLSKFQASIEAALNELVKNMRELDAKLETETEERKAADIVLDGKITAEATKREEEDNKLDAKIDQTKEELNTKIDDNKTELDTKIDNTKQELEDKISGVTIDTSGLVKKAGDTMEGNLDFSNQGETAHVYSKQTIFSNYGKNEKLTYRGTGVLFQTYAGTDSETPISLSYIRDNYERRTINGKQDAITGLSFVNTYQDFTSENGNTYNRMIFETPGRLIVRDGTETEEEKNASILYGKEVAYLSDCYIIDDLSDKVTEVPVNTKTHDLNSGGEGGLFTLTFGEDLNGYDAFIANMTIEGVDTIPGEHQATVTLFITKDDEKGKAGRGGNIQSIVTNDMHLIYLASAGISDVPDTSPAVKYYQNTGATLTITTNYLKGIRRG
jgi:hypothetical protein|nr:MAG TPA_asm: hypothetical protein [Caudoviricetes sp.]